MTRRIKNDFVYITGMGHQYPSNTIKQEEFNSLLKRLYPEHLFLPAVQKLLDFNTRTKISSRPTIFDHRKWTQKDAMPPTLASISQTFQTEGVKLSASACQKAMQEACLQPEDITHIVAVTCTGSGNPGYDLFVCEKLCLRQDVQRVLLQGVGCAGGLSALRTAADIAAAALLKRRSARVLVVACELCTLYLRAEMQNILQSGDETLRIAPTLFSDAAAALIVCNGLALERHQIPVFELTECASMVAPGTSDYMSYNTEKNGLIATISKDVPKAAVKGVALMFQQLCNTPGVSNSNKAPSRRAADLDWAIHPGGASILQGTKQSLELTDDQITASLDVYERYGNSSSASILIVLGNMRHLDQGRDEVAAVSFGPGLTVEMCMMRRFRNVAGPRLHMPIRRRSRMNSSWQSLCSKLSRRATRRHPAMVKECGSNED